ncbi:YodC family protein [Rhizobium ruizarguesonis]
MTPDEIFTVGDEVQHRTGGPKMIDTGKNQLGDAICEWFDGRQRHQETFSFVALKKAEQPNSPGIMVI